MDIVFYVFCILFIVHYISKKVYLYFIPKKCMYKIHYNIDNVYRNIVVTSKCNKEYVRDNVQNLIPENVTNKTLKVLSISKVYSQ